MRHIEQKLDDMIDLLGYMVEVDLPDALDDPATDMEELTKKVLELFQATGALLQTVFPFYTASLIVRNEDS